MITAGVVCTQCWPCKQLENKAKYCFCLEWKHFWSLISGIQSSTFCLEGIVTINIVQMDKLRQRRPVTHPANYWCSEEGTELSWSLQFPAGPIDCCRVWFGWLNGRQFGAAAALGTVMYEDFQNVVTWQNIAFVNSLLFQREREKQSLGGACMYMTIKTRSLHLSCDLLQDL